MIRFFLTSLLLASFAISAEAQSLSQRGIKGFQLYGVRGVRKFMPPNRLHQQRFRESASNVTKEQFDSIIDSTIALYQPLAAIYGVKLVAEKNWDDDTVNAFASQDVAKGIWTVAMFGGLARRPEITPDGFALVVCHELGHHFAGFSFYKGDVMSNEGQSDYYSTQACARQIWARDFRGNANFRRLTNVPPVVTQACAQAWPNNANAQGWCVRAAAAGQSLANLLAADTGQQPRFETPDQTVVPQTADEHPNAQCRLDTLFAGAVCNKNFDIRVIPGKLSATTTANEVQAEAQAAQFSCTTQEGFKIGTRPSCWFKSVAPASFRPGLVRRN